MLGSGIQIPYSPQLKEFKKCLPCCEVMAHYAVVTGAHGLNVTSQRM